MIDYNFFFSLLQKKKTEFSEYIFCWKKDQLFSLQKQWSGFLDCWNQKDKFLEREIFGILLTVSQVELNHGDHAWTDFHRFFFFYKID